MKILFFGDSITDAGRDRINVSSTAGMGYGFVRDIASSLLYKAPDKYEIINSGVSGNRIVDLYARIKSHVWNENPDVLNILIGVNDVWHELGSANGVDIKRYEKIYDMLITDTLERLPKVKITICEPFVVKGLATQENYQGFLEVKEYAKVAKKIADKYGLYFLPLQQAFEEIVEKYGADKIIPDGVHPGIAGAKLIAESWLQLFDVVEKDV